MKTVVYKTTKTLSCTCNCSDSIELILCVAPTLTALNLPYINAILTSTVLSGTLGGQQVYSYTINYEEGLLLNPAYSLVNTDILGVICKGCLTSYVESFVTSEGCFDCDNVPLCVRPYIYPQCYGAFGDGNHDDTASIQASLDLANANGEGTVYIIDGIYKVTTPLTVYSNTTLIVAGKLKSTDVTKNILNVSGSHVVIQGQGGSLEGPGTYVQNNSSLGSLIYVTGDFVSIRNLDLLEPPSVGVYFYICNNGKFENCQIIGGPLTKTAPQHYGVLIEAGSKHEISNNKIVPNSLGGACVQAIAGGIPAGVYPSQLVISDNVINGPLEKGLYTYGNDCTISGNTIVNPDEGMRHAGVRNIINGNTINGGTFGGINICNAQFTTVSNNVITNYEQVAICFNHINNSTLPLNNNTIIGNVCQGLDTKSYEAIRYDDGGYGATDVLISNNNIYGADLYGISPTHGIRIGQNGTTLKTKFRIVDNILDTIGSNGIHCFYLADSLISGNVITNVGQKGHGDIGIRLQQSCTNVTISNNKVKNTDAFLSRGISVNPGASNTFCTCLNNEVLGALISTAVYYDPTEGHSGRGNTRTQGGLFGTFTCTANATTTVSNAQIFNKDTHILLIPTNAVAASLMGSAKSLYISGVSAATEFYVHTGDNNAPAGTETFFYEIIQ